MNTEWIAQIPDVVKADRLWGSEAYRRALYFHDLAWDDCIVLRRDPSGRVHAEQLIRAVGSISANLEEGFGRGFGKDRDYFLRVALGSCREARGWYVRSRRLISPAILSERVALASGIIALLVTELAKHRRR